MEYHSDRFEDFSLLIYDQEKLVALLPANRVGATVFSHQGLTYGDFILDEKSKFHDVVKIFKITLKFLSDNNIKTLSLKPIPSIYHVFSKASS